MKNRTLNVLAVSAAFVVGLVCLWWYPQPTQAVEMTLQLPAMSYGNPIIILAEVDFGFLGDQFLEDEQIPITDLKVLVHDENGNEVAWTKFGFYGGILSQSGHFNTIIPAPSANPGWGWGYGKQYGYDLFAFGFGYQPHYYWEPDFINGYGAYLYDGDDGFGRFFDPEEFISCGKVDCHSPAEPQGGYGHFYHSWWDDMGGYGYGFGYQFLPERPRYLITFDPTGLAVGSYTIQMSIDVPPEPKQFVSYPYPFTLLAAPVAGPLPPPEPGVIDVSDVIDEEGIITEKVCGKSGDGNLELCIDEGTTTLTEDGNPISEITIEEMEATPPPPQGANIIGLTYDLGPDGATFDPPVQVTITYDPADIPEGVAAEDLVIAWWDEDAGVWVVLDDITVDPVTHTITGRISHLTPFTIIDVPPVVEEVEEEEAPVTPPVVPPVVEEEEEEIVPPVEEEVEPPVEEEEVEPPVVEEEEEIAPVVEEEVEPTTNWGLIIGIIAAVLVLGVLGFFLWRRRTA